jgi:PAS domain S-box-containing protein
MVNNKDNFVVGKIGIDHKGKINFFDQGAQEIFGYSSSEVEGQLLDILKYSSLASES